MYIVVTKQECVPVSKKEQYKICLSVLDEHFRDSVTTTEMARTLSEIKNELIIARENASDTEF